MTNAGTACRTGRSTKLRSKPSSTIWRPSSTRPGWNVFPCSTLVLHSRNEAVVPFAQGRLLATSIPGARFVPIESRNHLILEEEPAWTRFRAEVLDFLGS